MYKSYNILTKPKSIFGEDYELESGTYVNGQQWIFRNRALKRELISKIPGDWGISFQNRSKPVGSLVAFYLYLGEVQFDM